MNMEERKWEEGKESAAKDCRYGMGDIGPAKEES